MKQEQTAAPARWEAIESIETPGVWHVAKFDLDEVLIHTHPIPFDSEREAQRAAQRLNTREQKRG